jgi:hypothetical protein
MDEAHFWTIIAAGGPYGPDEQERQLASVRCQLVGLPATDVFFFYRLLFRQVIEAHTWDLWGAARLINRGCSEERFVFFRTWLISQGCAIYTAAVTNPDSLADVTRADRHDYEFQSLYVLPRRVYFELTGQDVPRLGLNWPPGLRGEPWDCDDPAVAARRLPRLAARYRTEAGAAPDRGGLRLSQQ